MNVVPKNLVVYFEQSGIKLKYNANKIINLKEDNSPSIYLICKGRVRVFCTGERGKEITLQIIGEGQLIGEPNFLYNISGTTTLSAVNDVEVIVCKLSSLMPFMQKSAALNELIFDVLLNNYGILCNQLKRLSLYDSTQRVASYLLEQTKNPRVSLGIINNTLPYTHEELSVCLNLNRVTVTRILNKFAKQDFVRLQQKQIQVKNRQALEKLLSVKHGEEEVD